MVAQDVHLIMQGPWSHIAVELVIRRSPHQIRMVLVSNVESLMRPVYDDGKPMRRTLSQNQWDSLLEEIRTSAAERVASDVSHNQAIRQHASDLGIIDHAIASFAEYTVWSAAAETIGKRQTGSDTQQMETADAAS